MLTNKLCSDGVAHRRLFHILPKSFCAALLASGIRQLHVAAVAREERGQEGVIPSADGCTMLLDGDTRRRTPLVTRAEIEPVRPARRPRQHGAEITKALLGLERAHQRVEYEADLRPVRDVVPSVARGDISLLPSSRKHSFLCELGGALLEPGPAPDDAAQHLIHPLHLPGRLAAPLVDLEATPQFLSGSLGHLQGRADAPEGGTVDGQGGAEVGLCIRHPERLDRLSAPYQGGVAAEELSSEALPNG
jgi:hypothetical protein